MPHALLQSAALYLQTAPFPSSKKRPWAVCPFNVVLAAENEARRYTPMIHACLTDSTIRFERERVVIKVGGMLLARSFLRYAGDINLYRVKLWGLNALCCCAGMLLDEKLFRDAGMILSKTNRGNPITNPTAERLDRNWERDERSNSFF